MSDGTYAEKARALRDKLDREARQGGYLLNPDAEMALALCEGLALNQERYGYLCCPCRLSGGSREKDLDIICPCDFRDADLAEFGACYCGLYVSPEIAEGRKPLTSIPERRPSPGEDTAKTAGPAPVSGKKPQVWRCKVCGYLCAADQAPLKCPVCKVDRDRFEPLEFSLPGQTIWRCKVCGYLCAKDQPPLKCPICKVDRDRFERF